jgi:hypothetical protein
MNVAQRAVLLSMVVLGGCSAHRSETPIVPVTIVAVPSAASTATPTPAVPARVEQDDPLAVDGIHLGAPIGALLARAPYAKPCDVDPIDGRTASLYFWAAGSCREAPPFPSETSVVVLTTRTHGTPPAAESITLIAWAGGPYFDGRTQLGFRMGDTSTRLTEILGSPTATQMTAELKNGVLSKSSAMSWDRVHAYFIDDKVAAVAVGELDASEPFTTKSERSTTLVRLYQHHLRYRGR